MDTMVLFRFYFIFYLFSVPVMVLAKPQSSLNGRINALNYNIKWPIKIDFDSLIRCVLY